MRDMSTLPQKLQAAIQRKSEIMSGKCIRIVEILQDQNSITVVAVSETAILDFTYWKFDEEISVNIIWNHILNALIENDEQFKTKLQHYIKYS